MRMKKNKRISRIFEENSNDFKDLKQREGRKMKRRREFAKKCVKKGLNGLFIAVAHDSQE